MSEVLTLKCPNCKSPDHHRVVWGISKEKIILGLILLLFVVMSCVGITWGLPSRDIDKYLFGHGEPWSGEKIYQLAGVDVDEKFSSSRGADVDVDPLEKQSDEPILLTGTDDDVAKIYLRYRLYTYQPDEMIAMMALAGMRPGEFKFDPRLYQYGGLFIYPVGVLIKLCGIVGFIDVRSDIVFYLDNPDEFGKFYIVARAYAALWGLIGVIVVFAITRRLHSGRAGLLAALMFTLMPVVVCLSHEGKPHLPGAVLMLLAVYFAMRYLNIQNAIFNKQSHNREGAGIISNPSPERKRRVSIDNSTLADKPTVPPDITPPLTKWGRRGGVHNWWLMCVCCGAAFGMVLSSGPIFILIPLVAFLKHKKHGQTSLTVPPYLRITINQSFTGVIVAFVVYFFTNPYILINFFINREVLQSNFGNSFAMYEISRIAEGLIRVLELTVEGATLPILILGFVALVIALFRKNRYILPLAIPALLFFSQFVLIGAGKPAEYGRFGIFPNVALAIGASCLLTHRWFKFRVIKNWISTSFVIVVLIAFGGLYLINFHEDSTGNGSRIRAMHGDTTKVALNRNQDPYWNTWLQNKTVTVTTEPAPYACPPLPFDDLDVYLFSHHNNIEQSNSLKLNNTWLIRAVDITTLSGMDDSPNPTRRLEDYADGLVKFFDRPTPISWANKPIEIIGISESAAP